MEKLNEIKKKIDEKRKHLESIKSTYDVNAVHEIEKEITDLEEEL